MTRKPTFARGSICLCQEYQNSGKPWRRTTTGPSVGPEATAWSSIGPLRKVRCSRSGGIGGKCTWKGGGGSMAGVTWLSGRGPCKINKPRPCRMVEVGQAGGNWLGGGGGFEAVGGDVGGSGGDFRDASFGIALSDGGVGLGGGFLRERA